MGNIHKNRKLILAAALVLAVLVVGSLFGPNVMNKIGKENVITSSQLEKAIDISQLSTAEFVYNGIAEKYDDDKPEKVECYIAYHADVKVGIQMEDVEFEIDEENKTVTPILPEISVNIAALDENEISYIPKNPDIPLKEIIVLCKEDAVREANDSKKLYQTAEENLKAVIEALVSPILHNKMAERQLRRIEHEEKDESGNQDAGCSCSQRRLPDRMCGEEKGSRFFRN